MQRVKNIFYQRFLIAARFLFPLFFFTLGSMLPEARAQEVIDRIVAIVDDQIILQSELLQYTYTLAVQMGIDARKEPEKFSQLQQGALESLIAQKVLYNKAKEDSVAVEQRQIDQILEERLKAMVDQLGSEEKVEEYFGQPMRKIRRMLRESVEEGLMVRTLQQRKFREIKISRREVEEFFRAAKDSLPGIKAAVHLSHILLSITPGEAATRAAQAKIDTVLKRVRSGEDFAGLARLYSEDPGSAQKGGELGFIQRGDFVKEFEEAAFALQPGEISGVVRTQFGFHIIQLIDRRGEKINARHILVRLSATGEDERATEAFARQLRDEILSGKISFEDAARKYSTDQTSNEKAGDLGWFESDQLQVPVFREAARTLQPGEISQPLRTQYGFHLVRLNERREPRQFTLEQDWQQLQEMALTHKSEQEFQKWLATLKKQMYIRVATLE
ncbi:MAG: peptidylprolyl isomerase [candidate division KSB1 bacterium]|nr:peptidylprolyl isomerase [candidate division KSB1 bacterium]MDZ7301950.1 peptidylprolyl isomerase [candidate division KSB1 bacterium]MDZ7312355.1 peptidylprolyl isomerase [candidate division KSB1 bacterium]